jgi:hypothetical protein
MNGRLPVIPANLGTITAKGDYPAFGSKLVPTTTAQGNVTFVNASTQAVGYGAGAVIFKASSGVTYRLRDGVSVGAGNPLAGTQGRASGVVVADRAGSVGNLPNGFTAYLSSAVAVQSGAINGGTEQPVKIVSKEDIDALRKQLIDQAQTDAQSQLKNKYNPANQDVQIVNGGEPNCQFTKNAGDQADSVSGNCSIALQAYVYNKTDLQKAVQDQFVSDPRLKADPTSIKIVGSGQLKNENNRLSLQVPVTGLIYTPIDQNALKNALANRPLAEMPQVLSAYPQIQPFDTSGVKGDKLPDASKIEFATTPNDTIPVATTTSGVTPSVTPKP